MTSATFQLQYGDTVGFVADQGGRGFHLPMSMVIRGDGRIFVVSRSNTQALDIVGIQMVTREHDFFGQFGGYGQEPGKMIWPTALALDGDDNLYLADDYLQRITVYDRDGAVQDTWGSKGSGAGEFDGPSGLLVDAEDNLLVVDHRNHRIQKFTRDGHSLGTWAGLAAATGSSTCRGASRRTARASCTWRTGATTASRSLRRREGSWPNLALPEPATGSSIAFRPGGGRRRQPLRGRLGQPARAGIRCRRQLPVAAARRGQVVAVGPGIY